MDWIEGLNQAIAYIDRNLDGEIDYEEISQITLSPVSLFQRFFVLAVGITLTEYIRRRKLTCALNELLKTDGKVIDIALKYGYETSDAFCVAFKRLYGITPSQAKSTDKSLKQYERIYFNLTVNYVKSQNDAILLNIDRYRYYEPLFEGVRIILNNMGQEYTPEYIQGISGAAFKIAGGCPSRPTSVCDRWTPDFIRFLGYEITEYPCFDKDGNDITSRMIEAVKKQIDSGKPALVWNALTSVEYDVVCGYDQDAKQFIGRGTYVGFDEYARKPWDRAKNCAYHDVPAFGAIIIGGKVSDFDKAEAELNSLVNAVKHARGVKDTANAREDEGVEFYYKWASAYEQEGRERGRADGYCYTVYSSVRKAAVVYLNELARKHLKATDYFRFAAACFEREVNELEKAYPYLSWDDSIWGIDEERSRKLAPILKEAATQYEMGIQYLEKILMILKVNY